MDTCSRAAPVGSVEVVPDAASPSASLLLAEPETAARELLERSLSGDGFRVLGAERSDETLRLVERDRPDLVLLGDGLDLCRRLRTLDERLALIVLGRPQADPGDRVR